MHKSGLSFSFSRALDVNVPSWPPAGEGLSSLYVWGQQRQPAHLSLQLQADELVHLSETWMLGFTLSCYHGKSVTKMQSPFPDPHLQPEALRCRRSTLHVVSESTWLAPHSYQSYGSWTINRGSCPFLKTWSPWCAFSASMKFLVFKLFAMFWVWSRTSIHCDLNSQKYLIQIYVALLLN